MGWHGNTREWCMRLTCASLAPVLSTVVLDLAGGSLPQGNWRVRVLSGLCTREFNDLWSRHPVCIAHLRCAFLIMSGGHHVNACFRLTKCFACATEQETMTDRFPISSSAFSDLPPQPSCQSCRLALHRAPGGLSAAALAHASLESLG